MACIQNFGQRVMLFPKLCNKHIRIILTSVLSGGQAACRLERADPLCWWKKIICEFISYFSIHSGRQVHSWNFDIRTPKSWTKLLHVLERKELLDSSSPFMHFFFQFSLFLGPGVSQNCWPLGSVISGAHIALKGFAVPLTGSNLYFLS